MRNCSPSRCDGVPRPGDAKLYLPGLALATLTNSPTVLAGTDGWTKKADEKPTATVTGSGTTYDVAVSGMAQDGTVIASLLAGVAHDAAGNASAASTSTDNTVTFDATPPTVTINQASGQTDPTNTSPIHFTVVFSESVSDFATGLRNSW